VDAAWLERHGFSRALRKKYVTNGWLKQVGRGVYRRAVSTSDDSEAIDKPRWEAVVVSLQTLLERKLSLGGRTALEQQGFSHYLSTSPRREVHLYGEDPPPGWLSKLELGTEFVFHNAARLFSEETVTASFGAGSLVHRPWGEHGWQLVMSAPERAVLELLDEVPRRETFHQADMLIEGLTTLSPRRLQPLLEECRSVKVKRLFFWFADRHNHSWLGKLNRSRIDLGSGKRMLVRGGKLDSRYNITVPEDMHAVV
jgi:hypothetical protein